MGGQVELTEKSIEFKAYCQFQDAMLKALDELDVALQSHTRPNFGTMADQWSDRVLWDAFSFKRYTLGEFVQLECLRSNMRTAQLRAKTAAQKGQIE